MANERAPSSGRKTRLTERLREDGRQRLETGKRTAADHIDEVAHALGRAGAELDRSEPTLASYASHLASGVGNLATRLRDGSLDDLLNDTRQLARRNPGMFVLGGVALGIAVSRFFKASAQQSGMSESESGYTGYTSASSTTVQPDPDSADVGSYSAGIAGSPREETARQESSLPTSGGG